MIEVRNSIFKKINIDTHKYNLITNNLSFLNGVKHLGGFFPIKGILRKPFHSFEFFHKSLRINPIASFNILDFFQSKLDFPLGKIKQTLQITQSKLSNIS